MACLRGRYVARLVEAVLGADLRGEALGRDVVLAGQCVVDVGPRVVGGQVVEKLIPRLVETMQSPEVPARGKPSRIIHTRADAGEVLDELGWLPPDLNAWGHVRGGPVYLHRAGRTESVSDFLMARYPVTNAQYERFIQAGGYDNPDYWAEEAGARQWWEKEGHQQGQPWAWGDSRFGRSRRGYPVVAVTWYEALAYCAWLTELLRRVGKGETLLEEEYELIAGLLDVRGREVLRVGGRRLVGVEEDRGKGVLEITLPSEAEWVRAAGGEGNDDRYPWHPPAYVPKGGPKLSVSRKEILARANVEESGLGCTTPVAMYPAGAFFPSSSEGGIMDLAGNVWEWTRDPWKKERPSKALRGGAWLWKADRARVGSCDYDYLEFPRPQRRVSGVRPVALLR